MGRYLGSFEFFAITDTYADIVWHLNNHKIEYRN